MTETSSSPPPQRRSLTRALLMPGLFFVGGLSLAGWVATQTAWGTKLVSPALPPAPIAVDPARLAGSSGELPSDVASRIAELEARLARTEAGASAAGPSAAPASNRVNGLVLAFAARRALERGQPLGAIGQELQAHFGAAQPHLIAAINNAAEKPVTLAELQTELKALAPALGGGGDSWWAQVQSGAANLISVRNVDQQSTDPRTIFANAMSNLDGGHVSAAIDQIARLKSKALATEWMEKAKRFAAAGSALDALEASAFTPAIVLPEAATVPVPTTPEATETLPQADPATGTF